MHRFDAIGIAARATFFSFIPLQSPLHQTSSFKGRQAILLSAMFAAVLSGCGGGGGGDTASAAGASASVGSLAAADTTASAGPTTSAGGSGSAGTTGAPGAPVTAVEPTGVNVTSYGARCDGATDDTAAIARGIADAKAKGVALVIPARQCNFSDVLRLDGAKIAGSGASSVLYATNWQRSSIFMSGAAPSVTNVKLTGVAAPSRQSPWESTKIAIMGASDFVIDHVTIEGAPAASIQTAQSPTRGTISNNVIRNSLSDSIHINSGSDITIDGNFIENSGDDGIAVVTYTKDSGITNHITARNNVVRNNKFGRNMSVVGGSDILYENNLLQGNQSGYACFLVAQESVGTLATKGATNVTFQRNTLENCGSRTTGHGGALIYSDGAEPNNNIALLSNLFNQQGQTGVRAYNNATFGLRVQNNQINGANPALDITTPNVTVTPYTSGSVGYTAP